MEGAVLLGDGVVSTPVLAHLGLAEGPLLGVQVVDEIADVAGQVLAVAVDAVDSTSIRRTPSSASMAFRTR